MTQRVKSSVTLPPEEFRLVKRLRSKLKLKSNVEVVRRGLRLLEDTTERAALREAYRRASADVRAAAGDELAELDALAGEGLD